MLFLLLATIPAADDARAVDFDTEIIPILTRSGCNAGACHGAAVGRGGFRLSLYGGDPAADFQSMVLELEGRRINLASPEESLVLLKPTGMISHGGGYRLDPDEEGAQRLLRWLTEGAARHQKRRLKSLEVTPAIHVADKPGSRVTLRATARFDDGKTEDVTQWTLFKAEDPAAVDIDADSATAVLLRRGRHLVVARYLDRVVPLQLIVPLSDNPIDLTKEPRRNFIDEHVLELLSTLRIPVSPPADDAAFLRRISLDLTGRLPKPKHVRGFLADKKPGKRDRLIDTLLASDEFTDYWTHRFAQLLRIRSQPQDKVGAQRYHNWLRSQIAAAAPYDSLARELLTSAGDTHTVGPANFYRTVGGAREQAEFVSELFMGNRLRCANCHNHPLDKWTQDDYHGLSAVFAKISRGRVVEVLSRGEVTHPRTGEAAVPRIPGERFLSAGGDGREQFADWLTHPKNPYFAKAAVNRLWKAGSWSRPTTCGPRTPPRIPRCWTDWRPILSSMVTTFGTR